MLWFIFRHGHLWGTNSSQPWHRRIALLEQKLGQSCCICHVSSSQPGHKHSGLPQFTAVLVSSRNHAKYQPVELFSNIFSKIVFPFNVSISRAWWYTCVILHYLSIYLYYITFDFLKFDNCNSWTVSVEIFRSQAVLTAPSQQHRKLLEKTTSPSSQRGPTASRSVWASFGTKLW